MYVTVSKFLQFLKTENIYVKKCADKCNFLGKISIDMNERQFVALYFTRISSLGIFQLGFAESRSSAILSEHMCF